MRKGSIAVAAALASVLFSAPLWAAPITGQGLPTDAIPDGEVEGFESFVEGSFTTFDFQTFTISGSGPMYSSSFLAGTHNSRGEMSLQNHMDGAQSITFTFRVPVTEFAFLFGASDDIWRITAYDSNHEVIETLDIPNLEGSNAGDYFGIDAGEPVIAYFTLENTYTIDAGFGDWIFLDDFTFGPAAAARTYLVIARNILEEMLPTDDKYANGAIERALDKLEDALDEEWIDDYHPYADSKTFRYLKGTIQNLNFALKMPDLSSEDWLGVWQSLSAVSEAAAEVAGEAVTDAGALFEDKIQDKHERWIGQAQKDYDKGRDMLLGQPQYFKAVKHFEQAWELCQRIPNSQ